MFDDFYAVLAATQNNNFNVCFRPEADVRNWLLFNPSGTFFYYKGSWIRSHCGASLIEPLGSMPVFFYRRYHGRG